MTNPQHKLIFLGTGTILPHPERGQAGFLLESQGERFLFDCGSGTETRLARAGIDPTSIDHIILSHHHIDHDSGVMPLIKGLWLAGKKKVTIHGPAGTTEWWLKLLEVWPYMKDKIEVVVEELEPGRQCAISQLFVTPEEMLHSIPALGYRVDFPEGGSLVYSGDTEPCEGLRQLLAGGAKVLVMECALPESLEVTNHTTPATLARFLESMAALWSCGASLKTLILTHFYPQNLGREQEIRAILEGAAPEVELVFASDGMEFKF